MERAARAIRELREQEAAGANLPTTLIPVNGGKGRVVAALERETDDLVVRAGERRFSVANGSNTDLFLVAWLDGLLQELEK
jgi:hypothetical protein